LHQARFSCAFCYALVHTVRNAAQIANKIIVNFKTEFFNRIDPKPTFQIPSNLPNYVNNHLFYNGAAYKESYKE